MRKRLLIAVLVVLMVAVVALTACRHKEEPTVKTIYEVSSGTAAVGTAIERAVNIADADNLYLSFKFAVHREGTYDDVYELQALLDLDDDAGCKLSFKNYQDLVNTISTEVYYTNGTLYLNRLPVVDHAAVEGVSMSQIASTLATSAQSGQINSILQLLPSLGNRVFSACERVQSADDVTYTFTVDFSGLGECISYLVSQTGLLSSAEMMRLLNLDQLDTTQDTKVTFVTRPVEGVGEVFVSATAANSAITQSLQSFSCVVVSDAAKEQSQYQVTLPDSLSSFGYAHPANLDLLGVVTFNVNSTSMNGAYLGAQPLSTYFNTCNYTWDVHVQSNVSPLGDWTASLVVTNQKDRDRHVDLFYAGNVLYVDLSTLHLGSWRITGAKLQEIATSLGRARSAQTLAAGDYRDIVLDLLVDRVEQGDDIRYTLKPDSIVKLFNALQEALTNSVLCTLPPVSLDNMTVNISTKNTTFHSLELAATLWGCNVSFKADNPSVGPAVAIATPAWTSACIDPLTASNLTPVASGRIVSNPASNKITSLLEAFILSTTGTEVALSGEVAKYHFAANVAGSGKIGIISVDFCTDHDETVCSLYYHTDSPDSLYVILPTRVLALSLKDTNRYVDFMRAVNGNLEISTAVAECTLSNSQSGLSLTWSNAGLTALLGRLQSVLSAPSITAIPADLGLQALRITVGSDRALRLMFAPDYYIEFGIDELAITDTSLALTTNASVNDASYFDESTLPKNITVSVGNGSAARRTVNVALADFGTQWAYDSIPALGSGNQLVTAHSTVFGQRVALTFSVDCTAPASAEVTIASRYAAYEADHVFTFSRYNATDAPVDVVQASRSATVYIGTKPTILAMTWLRNGTPVADADWSTADREDGADSYYTIVPAVKNFFGQTVPIDKCTVDGATRQLAGTYQLRLSGAKITTIKNATSYMTIATYTGAHYDPFDQATYNDADLVFRAGEADVDKADVQAWHWDVSSIANKSRENNGIQGASGALYTQAELVAALAEKLYALNGNYTIKLQIINALGVVERNVDVTIGVEPYVIEGVTFDGIADGATFTPAASGQSMGTFNLPAMAKDDVRYDYVFATGAIATFKNKVGTHTFVAKDWTVDPIAEVVMFNAYEGNIHLTLGDKAGGKQTISLRYAIAAEDVEGVALYGTVGGVRKELSGSLVEADGNTRTLTFAFDNLDPYDFILPEGLAIHRKDSGVDYVEHAFAFVDETGANMNVNELWHSDKTYTAQDKVYNVSVTIRMTFAKKQVKTGSWSFAGKVEAADGQYVFNTATGEWNAYVPAQHAGQKRYADLASTAVVHVERKSGAYVNIGGNYVLYDQNNPQHAGRARYTYDTIVAATDVYDAADDGDYVRIDDAYVPYDEDNPAHAGLARYARYYVVYRKGALDRLVLDPNKVDYRNVANYPTLVVVGFDDGTWAVLPAVWDLSLLANVNPEDDYTDWVVLSLPLAQELDKVYMRIESTKPGNAYYRVKMQDNHPVVDEDLHYVDGQNVVALNLLGVDDDGRLMVNDITSEAYIHSLVCGCSVEGCKGRLYFDYGDSTTANADFAITEWKGLELIATKLKEEAAAHAEDGLETLYFDVTVTAVAHNVGMPITVHVAASNLSNIAFTAEGMPLAASSVASGGKVVYSMTADGLALTIDPYIANVFDANNYPKELSFDVSILRRNKAGESSVQQVAAKAYVDSWDLSALSGITPYAGAAKTVYALLGVSLAGQNVGSVRIAVPVTVKSRIIDKVFVDGRSNRYIYVDVMSDNPFGDQVIVEGGRTIALKTVDVKFGGDDLTYHMTMRYDITDFAKAYYYNHALTTDTFAISVGNAAGGYQTIEGYRALTVANDVMRITVPADDPAYDLLKAYLKDGDGNWNGVLYEDEVFVAFDDSAEANDAWRALTTLNRTLVLGCGQNVDGVIVTTDHTSTLGVQSTLGVGFAWERAEMNGATVMRLKAWNTVARANDRIESVQYVSTGTNRYVALTRAMLTMSGVGDDSTYTKGYDAAYTVTDLLQVLTGVENDQLFGLDDLTSTVYAAADTQFASPLAADAVLTAGTYVWRIAVGNVLYDGYIDVAVTITPKALTDVAVFVGGERKNESALQAGIHVSVNSELTVEAVDNATGKAINVVYYNGPTPLVGAPEEPGTYTVYLIPADDNYVVSIGAGFNSFELMLE